MMLPTVGQGDIRRVGRAELAQTGREPCGVLAQRGGGGHDQKLSEAEEGDAGHVRVESCLVAQAAARVLVAPKAFVELHFRVPECIAAHYFVHLLQPAPPVEVLGLRGMTGLLS